MRWIDLDDLPAGSGVEKVDSHTWRIRVKGKYPQFLYWLAMPFFAPVPREVDRFLRTARHGSQKPDAGLVASRDRAIHAGGK
jgi:hypothetical protein